MKKKFFVLSVVAAILAAVVVSCEKDVDYGYSMTMTTEASDVTFLMRVKFNNKIEVDWGNGIIEKYKPGDFFDGRLKRENLGTSPKTITITGCVTSLTCEVNQLTNLDVSKNPMLTYLNCSGNQLTNLDVSKNTALTVLGCYNNQLTNLDVSKNTALRNLGCDRNQLTNLDVSKNTALSELYCYSNQLTNLDVSKNTALYYFYSSDNQLTNLDVSKNTMMTMLSCSSNQLTNLDVSKNTNLGGLGCGGNQLTTAALNDLFGTLHSNPSPTYKVIFIGDNPGTNTCDRSIAESKGWNVSD